MADFGRTFTADDAWAFNGGTHVSAHEVLGAHPGADGVTFRVWAPDARSVHVIGEFNHWTHGDASALDADPSGVWRGTVADAEPGQAFKYRIRPRYGPAFDKADPVAFAAEEPPRTASVITTLEYEWSDADWMGRRGATLAVNAPVSIYEVHLGSWRYEPGGYRAIGEQLVDYVTTMGFTHVELLPVTEHPYYGSWGYQTTGYFAPTARYGRPADFMAMIDMLHQAGVGVILDWVPSHFPTDAHGLANFDGTHLYEHADPRLGFHPDWKSNIFNYDRNEVRSFLLSSAHFWADVFHIDALRVDAVASMLYRDYSRDEGQWIPNQYGGKENLGAVSFLQELNRTLYRSYPDIQVIAEESTAWPGVTKPVDQGGLGFGYKWDMGWMNDTLRYMKRDPIHRRYHHNDITFRSVYQSAENYVLPLSHDEVVHGKGSLLTSMPGDESQKRASLRLLFGYQWSVPGKKLLFMGGEFGVHREWQHEQELDWKVLTDLGHKGIQDFVAALNDLYRTEPALHLGDCATDGSRWIVGDDMDNSVFAFLRQADGVDPMLVVANFTPQSHDAYRIGVPLPGTWTPVLESDDNRFGGDGFVNEPLETEDGESHGFDQSIDVRVGPLAVSFWTVTPAPTDAGTGDEEE
jgi:1,4-alpha-glucan branching enzyme